MRYVKARLSIGYPTAIHEEEIEVEDDATDEEIDSEVEEWAWNYIEIGWSKGGQVKPERKRRREWPEIV